MELLDGEENQYITYIAYLLKTFLKKEGYITDIYFYCGDVFGLKAICTLCSCEGMFVFYDPNCLELRQSDGFDFIRDDESMNSSDMVERWSIL